ncbi:hypothetical protein ACIQU6_28075 [Streptomyces sp. NPDC090442]|uniref:hypothetical protein n=1 Tax=Streptomyces sp. NPDC090442 TaxID=3365962 RepID=UPI0038134FC8
MSHLRVAFFAIALAGTVTLTACSSGSDAPSSASGTPDGGKSASSPAPKPITTSVPQAKLTQALLDDGETLPGWSLHGTKRVAKGYSCNTSGTDSAPKGWVRGSQSAYEYKGSTKNMAFVNICLFDTAENAHSAYVAWKGTEKNKQQAPTTSVGEESTLVLNPGLSEDSVYGYSRSGKVDIRVRIDGGNGGDPSGAQAMLTATLKRLQQLEAGNPATITAPDELATARK